VAKINPRIKGFRKDSIQLLYTKIRSVEGKWKNKYWHLFTKFANN
jgi:hypothetical protein